MPKRSRAELEASGADGDDWGAMHPGMSSAAGNSKLSRRELRKQQRKAKKQKRAPIPRQQPSKKRRTARESRDAQPQVQRAQEQPRVRFAQQRKPKKSILSSGKNADFYKSLKKQNLIGSSSFSAASQNDRAAFLEGDDSDPEDAEIERLEKLLGVSGNKTKEAAREFDEAPEEADGDAAAGPKRKRTKAWKQMELELRKDGYGAGLADLMMDLDRIGSGHLREEEGKSASRRNDSDSDTDSGSDSDSDSSDSGSDSDSDSGSESAGESDSSSDPSSSSSTGDSSDSSSDQEEVEEEGEGEEEEGTAGQQGSRSKLAALIRAREKQTGTSVGDRARAKAGSDSDASSGSGSGSGDDDGDDDEDQDDDDDEANRFRKAAARRRAMAAAMYGGGASGDTDSDSEEDSGTSRGQAAGSEQPGAAPRQTPGAYVPPHLRRAAAAAAAASSTSGSAAARSSPASSGLPRSSEDDARMATMKRRIKGLINRLAETNVDPISKELHGLRGPYASAEVTTATAACVTEQLCAGTKVGEQLIVVYAAVLATQHVYAGAGAGSALLEAVVVKLRRALDLPDTEEEAEAQAASGFASDGAGEAASKAARGRGASQEEEGSDDDEDGSDGLTTNEQQNLSMLLGYMFLMGMVQAAFVVDVLRLLACRLRGADVRIVLLLLKLVGSQLRSDDNEGVRKLLQLVKRRATELGYVVGKGKAAGASAAARASGGERARVQVVLELLGGLRRAKQKQDQADSEERGSRLRKWIFKLRRSTQADDGSVGDRQIRIRWEDIVHIRSRGRWWITGASWAGRPGIDGQQDAKRPAGEAASSRPGSDKPSGSKLGSTLAAADASSRSGGDAALLEAASRMRMNTDLRRRIFVAVMGSQGVQDAIERVGSLGLRGAQEREVVRVLLDCCGQEKQYNPYYAAVGARLCEDNQSFRFTFQLSLWDQFKLFGEAPPRRIYNLARLSAALVQRFVLGLSFLKVFNFLRPTKTTLLFLRTCIGTILEDTPEAEQKALWKRIGSGADRGSTRDGLILFLQGKFGKFVDVMHPGSSAEAEAMRQRLRARIQLAVRVLESQAGMQEAEEATAMLEARGAGSGAPPGRGGGKRGRGRGRGRGRR